MSMGEAGTGATKLRCDKSKEKPIPLQSYRRFFLLLQHFFLARADPQRQIAKQQIGFQGFKQETAIACKTKTHYVR
jgi:hypothetical protein